jgi:N-acetylmuramic acid 6-phosphate etherase
MRTEDINPRYLDLDSWATLDALQAIYEGQLAAVAAVGPALPAIAAAVEAALPRLRQGGRLVYAGAGTSGRIAVQDGVELVPTFDWSENRLVFLLAGGPASLTRSIEDAEDNAADAVAQIQHAKLGPKDVFIGVTASGETAFTVAALEAARATGAQTIGVANNAASRLLASAEFPILVETGAEAVAGSTRMKAGTAQKIVLNLFSTLVMIKLGRVFHGMMVQMRLSNAKLRQRGAQMVAIIAGCDQPAAAAALSQAAGDIQVGVAIALGLTPDEARRLLQRHGGQLRSAMAEIAGRRASDAAPDEAAE